MQQLRSFFGCGSGFGFIITCCCGGCPCPGGAYIICNTQSQINYLAHLVLFRKSFVPAVVLADVDKAGGVDQAPAPNLVAEDTLAAGDSSVGGSFAEGSRGHVDSEDSPAADLGIYKTQKLVSISAQEGCEDDAGVCSSGRGEVQAMQSIRVQPPDTLHCDRRFHIAIAIATGLAASATNRPREAKKAESTYAA
jgi:hypothetical protein